MVTRSAVRRVTLVGIGSSLAAALALVASCGDDPELSDEPESPPVIRPTAVTLSPTRELARQAQDYMLNYGDWDSSEVALAQTHDLVIVDPNDSTVTRSLVQQIQGGTDPSDPDARVLVLCYVSVGEDLRTEHLTDAEMAGLPRFTGNGLGPRVDPRGPFADGQSLGGIDPLGAPSPAGTGWASWYLDDVSVDNDPNNIGDGIPDRNGNFNTYFVNAGDPAWFEALQDMTVDGVDGVAGLREILTTSYGRGLGCDGLFMDTFDTAFPNAWTDAASSNQSEFEWTAPGFTQFVQRLRNVYPDVVLLQNRGLFFFNPFNIQYPFHAGDLLDFVLFESYRLNSGDFNNPDPYFYPDNRFNFTPKLMAEAERPNGFRVLSLGYAEGEVSELTLLGQSNQGFDSLIEDIRVAERLAGFRHYLSDSSVTLVNRFVRDHADRSDVRPPEWTSTYNDNNGNPPREPTPRIGIQEIAPGDGSLTVRWDVALDLNRVGYAVYYQTTPFDFDADPTLSSATRLVLPHEQPETYRTGVGPGIYANQATITNLTPGQTYYLVIRAFDALGHEDDNRIVLSAVPAGEASSDPYVGRWSASNGVSSLTYRLQHSDDWHWRRVYIDRDRLAGTGWNAYGIGADFLIENGALYQYAGSGTDWAWNWVRNLNLTETPVNGMTFVQWDLQQSDIGAGYRHTNLVFQVQKMFDVRTGGIYEHVYTTTDPNSPYLDYYAENDRDTIYYHADISAPFRYEHIFIDEDANPNTGYRIGGIGAGYLIENNSLYRHVGPGWTWTRQASANRQVSGNQHSWSLSRADVGATQGAPLHHVVFQANGDAPGFMTPIYAHRFSP